MYGLQSLFTFDFENCHVRALSAARRR
jgi:hypothetical protein